VKREKLVFYFILAGALYFFSHKGLLTNILIFTICGALAQIVCAIFEAASFKKTVTDLSLKPGSRIEITSARPWWNKLRKILVKDIEDIHPVEKILPDTDDSKNRND
jgi:hypothetical protein